ncbi:hypothetical protein PSM38_18170 [Clostridioides difficile]|nr:hypothetical protein [Clostridioides difficile]MDC9396125.1 hypothetical protein [Clostridioides difficile]
MLTESTSILGLMVVGALIGNRTNKNCCALSKWWAYDNADR